MLPSTQPKQQKIRGPIYNVSTYPQRFGGKWWLWTTPSTLLSRELFFFICSIIESIIYGCCIATDRYRLSLQWKTRKGIKGICGDKELLAMTSFSFSKLNKIATDVSVMYYAVILFNQYLKYITNRSKKILSNYE